MHHTHPAHQHEEHDASHETLLVSRRTIKMIVAALVPAAVATLIGLIFLWPGKPDNAEPWTGANHLDAQVLAVREVPCPPMAEGEPHAPPVDRRCGDVVVRLDEGPRRGQQVSTEIPSGRGAPVVAVGDKVIVIEAEAFDQPGVTTFQIMDHERSSALWALVLAFVFAVVAFGRWRGVRALGGLAITFAILLLFVVPAILDGSPPLLVAIIGSAAIMLVVLYLTHGVNVPTSMAVLGTLASLSLTGMLAALSTALLKLTGVASEEASFLSMQYTNVNMLGLLLAGILIGSLGVLDDVAVTQAYTVTELAQANPGMGFGRLYQAASRVGRAHITSVINTIVLAYAGASLPVLLLLTAGGAPLGQMVTSEWLTQEIVRSAVGTLGLIAAVPITTALTALAARNTINPPPPAAAPRAGRRRRTDPLETAWEVDDDTAPPVSSPRRRLG